MSQVPAGTVVALYRFPVKSMRAESVEQAGLYWHGLEGDRRYAFVRGDDLSAFPWLTARELPELLRYTPYLADAERPRESAVRVRTPAGEDVPIESDWLRRTLQERYGGPIHLLHINRGAPDSAALSLISTATLRHLGSQLDLALDPRRFRQNIVIEPAGGEPFVEEGWLGRRVRFRDGGAAARLNRPDGRCMMVNLDPETARQEPRVLREIVQQRNSNLGVYGSVEQLGPIRVGDPVLLD